MNSKENSNNKPVNEKFKKRMRDYFKTQMYANKEKLMNKDKNSKEAFAELLRNLKENSEYKNFVKGIMKEIVKERADANITKGIGDKSERLTNAYILESAKDEGRTKSHERLTGVMKDYSRKEINNDINALVQKRLKAKIKDNTHAELKGYASKRINTLDEISSVESYAEKKMESSVIGGVDDVVNKFIIKKENR